MNGTDLTINEEYQKNRERVLGLLRKYADNSISYLALEPDKKWYFPDTVDGVASYAQSGNVLVVCGEPICDPKRMPAFLAEMKIWAKEQGVHLIFLFILKKNLALFKKFGFGSGKIGEEAVFDLASYNLSGGKIAKVRAAINHARKAGIRVFEYRPLEASDQTIEQQFQKISDEWLEKKQTSRLQFALGDTGFSFPYDKRYFYAIDQNNKIQGFMVFLPYRLGKGYMADVTRRHPDAPYGVMEILFYDSINLLKTEGTQYASLGVAPLANVKEHKHDGLFAALLSYIYENMNSVYGFKPLFHAKNKFNPIWEPIYLVHRPKYMSPAMGHALIDVLDTNGFKDYVHTFIKTHSREKRNHHIDGFLARDHVKLYYRLEQPAKGKKKPCMVLLHGNHSSSLMFRRFIDAFRDQYQFLLIDSRGHGRSGLGRKDLSIDLLAEDVHAILKILSIDHAIFMGFSDGANIALTEALRYPSSVDALICISGNLHPEGIIRPVRHGIRLLHSILKAISPYAKRFAHEAQLFGLMSSQPKLRSSQLVNITCPTLFLTGEFDIIRKKHTEKASRQVKGSSSHIIPFAGHNGLLYRSEAYHKQIRDFLK